MELFSSFSYSAPPTDYDEKSKSSMPAMRNIPSASIEQRQKTPIEKDNLISGVKQTDQDNSYDVETEVVIEAEESEAEIQTIEAEIQTIKPISESSIQRIVAGQAITDLASAVKELVDNAIDSRATKVFVRLYNQGLDSIEVSDNGTGVPKSSRPLMAMKHATSKLKSFEELYNGTGLKIDGNVYDADNDQDPTYAAAPTLGFRGEALFCLANLSRSLVVTTRCESTNDGNDGGLGEEFAFNHEGLLIPESVKPIPRPVGTTVTVNGLFEPLPVRRVDMQKRIKAQRMKLMKMMQGYAILCTNIQFMLTDIQTKSSQPSKPKSNSDVRLATSESSNTLEKRTASVLGTKFLAGLIRIEVDLTSLVEPINANLSQKTSTVFTRSCRWKMEGLVSHAPTSPKPSSARDLQFFSINGRPVDLPTISRVLGDVWRSYYPTTAAGGNGGGARRRPACILAFTLPNNMYDVNLSPDKREVMFTEEIAITALIRESLARIWADQSEGHFAANVVESRSNSKTTPFSHENEKNGEKISLSQKDPGNADNENVTPRLRRSKASLDRVSIEEEIMVSGNPAAITPQEEIHIDDKDNVASMIKSTVAVDSYTGSANSSQVSILNHSPTGEDALSDKVPNQSDISAPFPRIKPSRNDSRRWDQMRLDYRRIEKSQLQEEIHQVLSSDHDACEELQDNPINQNQRASTAGRKESNKRAPETNSNFEPPSKYNSPKRSKRSNQDKCSFLNDFAFQSGMYTKAHTEEGSVNGHKDERALTHDSDNEERSYKEIQISKKRNRRMVIGRRVEVTNRSRNVNKEEGISDSSQSIDPPTRDESHHNEKSESLPSKQFADEVIWNAFLGTNNVISDYENARTDMRKNRNLVQSSLRKEKNSFFNIDNGEETTSDEKDATVELTKEDFKHMSIIGQFNLGFILARCRKQNLWILDQHACDEIYNFERMCKETVIHEQKLIAPLPLELSPSEENCVLENMDIFERNGFRFIYDPDKEIRHRLSLTALPHSGSGRDGKKPVQFGREDVGALCAMLGADGSTSSDGFNAGFGSGADGSGLYGNNAVRRYAEASGLSQSVERHSKGVTGSNIVRLPKAIAMFASRACRGSIMIGDALSRKEQNAVVEKLHKVDIPWNCPHGRPTMSHVRSLAEWLLDDDKEMSAHVAGPSLSVFSQE